MFKLIAAAAVVAALSHADWENGAGLLRWALLLRLLRRPSQRPR